MFLDPDIPEQGSEARQINPPGPESRSILSSAEIVVSAAAAATANAAAAISDTSDVIPTPSALYPFDSCLWVPVKNAFSGSDIFSGAGDGVKNPSGFSRPKSSRFWTGTLRPVFLRQGKNESVRGNSNREVGKGCLES